MSLTQFLGQLEIPRLTGNRGTAATDQNVLNAAGEELHFVGQVYLEGGSSSASKTISSSGGKIWWYTGTTTTFADAGTTLRIGIQDVSASSPSQGDATFDVYGDLVGGTDTINTSTAYGTAMGAGTKTIAHGDLVAVVFDMVSRGGADDVRVKTFDHPSNVGTNRRPSVVLAAPTATRVNSTPCALIEFDDGTLGWLYGSLYMNNASNLSFGVSTSVADEYGNLFQVPVKVNMAGVTLNTDTSAFTADYEILLYEDPLGTPSVLETITVDASQLVTTFLPGVDMHMLTGDRLLQPGVVYGVTIRPTTASTLTLYYNDVSVSSHWKSSGLSGDNCYAIRRLDNTGAFSDYNSGTA